MANYLIFLVTTKNIIVAHQRVHSVGISIRKKGPYLCHVYAMSVFREGVSPALIETKKDLILNTMTPAVSAHYLGTLSSQLAISDPGEPST